MNRLLFVFLMMVCSTPWAGWEYATSVETRDGKVTNYYDKSTIRKNGTIVKIWTLSDYSLSQTDSSGEKYRSDKTLLVFNCREEAMALISITYYSGQMGEGQPVWSGTLKESEWAWEPIIPGTVGEKSWKTACYK
jgi:hypothetical protein